MLLEQFDKALAHVWELVGKARNYQVRIAGEILISSGLSYAALYR